MLKHQNQIKGNKAKSRGLKGVLVGYGEPYGLKGYRVYVPELRKIVTSPNARFLDSLEQSMDERAGMEDLKQTQNPAILQPFQDADEAALDADEEMSTEGPENMNDDDNAFENKNPDCGSNRNSANQEAPNEPISEVRFDGQPTSEDHHSTTVRVRA